MENTVLVGIITQAQGASKSKEYLDELDFLTITAGGKVVKRFVQKLNMPKEAEITSRKAINIDPAISSSVFVTTITDVIGFLSFLGIGSYFFLS